MKDFDQTRADRDTILYNTDGRLFDLIETGKSLNLCSRPNAFLLSIFSLIVSFGLAFFTSKLVFGVISMQADVFTAVLWMLSWLIIILVTRFFGIYEPKQWILDKTTGFLFADAKKLAPLSEISKVRCFKMQHRLKLVLILHNGREFHLGWLRFAGKEWAWRQDAAQIADFLGVPLEIPPV